MRMIAGLALVCALALPTAALPAADWTYTNNGTVTFNSGDVYPSSGSYSGYRYTNNGTINVMGDSMIGSTTANIPFYYWDWIDTRMTLRNTGTGGTIVNIGDATHNATLTLADVQVQPRNEAGGIINIAAGSTLSLKANALSAAPGQTNVTMLNNYGMLNLAGKYQVAPSYPANNGYATMLQNYGSLEIQGPNAVFERTLAPAGQIGATERAGYFIVGSTGVLTGSGTLTYLNSTGTTKYDRPQIIMHGMVAPGSAAGPGTLEIRDMNVSFGSWADTAIRLGGTDDGEFDVLRVSGTGASLTISSANTLAVSLVNGFVPRYGDSWVIMEAPTLSGGFQYLPANYQVAYDGQHVTLTYVPEPASIVALALGSLAILRRRKWCVA